LYIWKTVCVCLALYIKSYVIFLRLLGYEGLEVINPDGGTDDAEAEALWGR
jgi:hypothetical protein